MSKNEIKNTDAAPDREEIAFLDDEPPSAIERRDATFGPLSAEALLDEDVLGAHVRLTAPDRLMEGFELQEASYNLYLGLDPKNTIQAMIATLAVNIFNTSTSCLADGNLRSSPPHVRNINVRHGIKAATVAAALLEKFQEMRDGGQKSFKVGRVNVEAGGQAIVGNVQSTRRGAKPERATMTSRPRKKNRRG